MFFPPSSEKLATPKSRNICQVGEDIRILRLLIEIAKKHTTSLYKKEIILSIKELLLHHEAFDSIIIIDYRMEHEGHLYNTEG